jgi:hypothetical protein
MTESSAPATEVQNEIEALTGRDLQLWSIVLVMSVVLFLGFMAVALPPLAPGARSMKIEAAYLPQLFVGLAVLIILFNLYIIRQKQVVNVTRRALIREAVYSERLESFSLIDPHTQLLNRQALEKLVPRELARANRMGTSLSFMVMTTELNTVEKRSGARGRDKFVTEVAGVLRGTFRDRTRCFTCVRGSSWWLCPTPASSRHNGRPKGC